MKRSARFSGVCLAVALCLPTASVATVRRATPVRSWPQAPMDRYFGRLAMSPLGVINAIALESNRADEKAVDATGASANLALIEDSVRDWERHFPADRWLPRMYLGMDTVYRKFGDSRSNANARRLEAYLERRYPRSKETRLLRESSTVAAAPRPAAPAPSDAAQGAAVESATASPAATSTSSPGALATPVAEAVSSEVKATAPVAPLTAR